ncbi:MAG: glycine--tRNA ligase subunit beta [Myxococcota bacterium]
MSELFVEIRCEELPAADIDAAVAGLAEQLKGLLKGVPFGAVQTWATPRRIAVAIADVAEGRPIEEKLVTGPPEKAAYRDGTPTRAAEGFARGRGISVDALEIVEGPRGRVVAARIKEGGERTRDIVAEGLEAAVLAVPFKRTMRWGATSHRWARPFHAVAALFGGERIEATVVGQPTVEQTLAHRLTPGPVPFTDSVSWLEGLRAHNVEPDTSIRRKSIEAQLNADLAALGGEIRDWDLLDEVVHLVEWPVVVRASFGEDLLALPPRLLVESMKVHQRVFPVYINDVLDHHFLVVSNQPFARAPASVKTISEGNKRVLTARFYDARFFYAEDRRKGLLGYSQRLAGMQWIRKGGTMADKAARVSILAKDLAVRFGADPSQAARAGALCKNDLATQMVGEFPELQGHVGRLLAAELGEPEAVSLAIEEHYLPRFQGDALPTSPTGRTLAIADRVDSLGGCFRMGLKPRGSADPLGLRRAANGLVTLLLAAQVSAPILSLFPEADQSDDLTAFLVARMKSSFQDTFATDLVNAVLAGGDTDPVALQARLTALDEIAKTDEFGPLKTTFKRVMGLTKDHPGTDYAVDVLEDPAEKDLHEAFVAVRDEARRHSKALDYRAALASLKSLKPHVDRLFDEVLVMTEDERLRTNRLSLLRAIADEFAVIVDFTQLSAEG